MNLVPGLWADDNRLETEQRVVNRDQELWLWVVREVQRILGRLMHDSNYDLLSAKKRVREYLGIKITPWQDILDGGENIPGYMRSQIQGIHDQLQAWLP